MYQCFVFKCYGTKNHPELFKVSKSLKFTDVFS